MFGGADHRSTGVGGYRVGRGTLKVHAVRGALGIRRATFYPLRRVFPETSGRAGGRSGKATKARSGDRAFPKPMMAALAAAIIGRQQTREISPSPCGSRSHSEWQPATGERAISGAAARAATETRDRDAGDRCGAGRRNRGENELIENGLLDIDAHPRDRLVG